MEPDLGNIIPKSFDCQSFVESKALLLRLVGGEVHLANGRALQNLVSWSTNVRSFNSDHSDHVVECQKYLPTGIDMGEKILARR